MTLSMVTHKKGYCMKKSHLFSLLSFSVSFFTFHYLGAIREIISEQEFNQALQQNQKVIVDFYANWSRSCQYMIVLLEELEKEFSAVLFLKVNTDLLRNLANSYNIRNLPTLILFRDGCEVDRIPELLPKSTIEERIIKAFP